MQISPHGCLLAKSWECQVHSLRPLFTCSNGHYFRRRWSIQHVDGAELAAGRVQVGEASIKGLSGNVTRFETAFVLVCHYAISKLCQGMCHHYGARHVSPRLHIHQFRPWAPVRLPGVCFLSTACGTRSAPERTSSAPARLQAGSAASALQDIEEGHDLSAWHQPAAQNAQDAVRLWLGTQR